MDVEITEQDLSGWPSLLFRVQFRNPILAIPSRSHYGAGYRRSLDRPGPMRISAGGKQQHERDPLRDSPMHGQVQLPINRIGSEPSQLDAASAIISKILPLRPLTSESSITVPGWASVAKYTKRPSVPPTWPDWPTS